MTIFEMSKHFYDTRLEAEYQPQRNRSQDYASTMGSGPDESVAKADASAGIATGSVAALDVPELNKVSLITCDMSPCSCSTVILELSREIFASCDSSCKMVQIVPF